MTERLKLIGVTPLELRADLIGLDALHSDRGGPAGEPCDVRLRVAARTESRENAWRVAREVESLYTNGPAGGGGASMSVRQVLAMRSTLVPRDRISWRVDYVAI